MHQKGPLEGVPPTGQIGFGLPKEIIPVPSDPIGGTVWRSSAPVSARHEKGPPDGVTADLSGVGDHGGAEIVPFLLYNLRGRRVFLNEKTRRCGLRAPAGSTRGGDRGSKPPARTGNRYRAVAFRDPGAGLACGTAFPPSGATLTSRGCGVSQWPEPRETLPIGWRRRPTLLPALEAVIRDQVRKIAKRATMAAAVDAKIVPPLTKALYVLSCSR